MEGTSGNPTRPRVARDEAGPSNPHANMAERPIPQENPLIRPLPEEGNREALLNQCHRLVSAQLQHFFERGKKRWELSTSTQHYDEAAQRILSYDLEMHQETDITEIKGLLDSMIPAFLFLSGRIPFRLVRVARLFNEDWRG